MNVIGLDFGTTNSILSFYNKTNSVESLHNTATKTIKDIVQSI